jgi:hypothetical protein
MKVFCDQVDCRRFMAGIQVVIRQMNYRTIVLSPFSVFVLAHLLMLAACGLESRRAGDVGNAHHQPFCSVVRALSLIEDIQRVCAIIDEVDSLTARNDDEAKERA